MNNDRPVTPVQRDANPASVREQAEAVLRKRGASPPTLLSPEHALHELQVHQIELEMQNEELRRVRSEMEASRARYFELYDLAPVGYCRLSASGVILQVNLAAASLLGMQRSALAQQSISRFIFEADQDTYYLNRKRIVEGGRVLPWELRIVRPTGQATWVQMEGSMAPAAVGPEQILLVLSDISARKQAEASLRESDERLRAAVKASGVGLWDWDLKTNRVHYSAEWKRQLGYAEHEIADDFSEWESRVHPDDLAPTLARVHQHLAQPEVAHEVEYRLRHKDGTWRWIYTRGESFRDAAGRPVRMLGCHVDITDIKLAEEKQRDEHDLLQAVIGNAAVGIAQVSPAGRFLLINQEFCRIIGYTQQEVLNQGFTFQQITFTDDLETDLAQVNRLLRGDGDRYTLEKRYLRKDGDLVWVSLSVFLQRDAEGRPLYFISAAQDINARKGLDAELHSYRQGLETMVAERTSELVAARMQADAANQAKSAFLSGMSHEIRTPMSAIIGMTDLLRRGAPTPEQVSRLDKIDTAGQHLLEIINDLLDLSKIEAGRVELEAIDFNLGTVMDEVGAIVGDAARRKGLLVDIEYAAVASCLRGDPLRLRQALLNYASNAVKFTAQGRVTLRVELLTESGDQVLLRFWVEDTGPGISADRQARLFQDFEQAGTSVMRTHGGTGLGLAITRRLARLMGGDAGVHSAPGEGSRFWFTACLLKVQAAAAPMPAADADATRAQVRQTHGGARILLVEDNEVNRELALIWLEELGMTVDLAADGLEAVEQAKRAAYDLVLMDMQMPEMDGLQATRAIRALPGWQDTPILALTANAFDDSRRTCEAAGMNDVIGKPVNLPVLHAALSRWLKAGG